MHILRFLAAVLLASVVASSRAQGDTVQAGPTYIVNTKADHDDGVCGNSDCTLREAINAASIAGQTVRFAPNVRGTITLTGGELVVASNLSIEGPGADLLSIDAHSMSRVMDIFDASVFIKGLTLTHGLVSGPVGRGRIAGGCIYTDGILGLDSCAITNNSVVGTSDVSGNQTAGYAFGGAVFVNSQQCNFHACTFSHNSVNGGDAASRSIGITGGPGWGGAVYAVSGVTTITNCTFSGNTATGGYPSAGPGRPGGLAQGGAIYFETKADMQYCTISGNSATGGPGGFPAPDGRGEGGGVYQTGSGPSYEIDSVQNLIAGNSASTDAPDVFGSFTSNGWNLIGKVDGSDGFTLANDYTGTVAAPLNPMLDPAGLKYNGGRTQTIALLPGSPAIDKGNPDQSLPQDQRYYNRNGVADIGAFEFHGTIPGLLYNISTRAFVQTGNNVLIGGVIVNGTGPKSVLLRALGPTLGQAPFNVPNALANPTLDLFQGSTLIASNDNWGTAANKQAIINTGLAPPNSLESAILTNLNPGAYTAIIRGVNNTAGNALFEAYDLNDTAASRFGNISTRGFVQTGNNVMIAGVIVHGPESEPAVIRALGPTLGQPPFSVPNALQNPFLDLRDANGMRVDANDNWKSTNQSQIEATGFAPPDDRESAIFTNLGSGNYTAIVTGVNNTTGNALIEVYGLNN